MTITQEKIDNLVSSIKINLKKEDYEPKVKAEIKKLAKAVQIKGFRPGNDEEYSGRRQIIQGY